MQIVILNKENPVGFERFNLFNHSWKRASFNDLYLISSFYVDYGIIAGYVANEKSILIKKEDLFDFWDVEFYLKTIIKLLALLHSIYFLV